MAYSELIKNFEKIRGYMREFHVYGFKSRDEYDAKSARSYDNERRRIESWLGDYMRFRRDSTGKNVFLTMDSRRIPRNPLYKAFKARSFTDNDIILHFCILDLLADEETLTVKQIVDVLADNYFSCFPEAELLDDSTVRKKLKEYEALGLLESEKIGRELAFRRSRDNISLDTWHDAAAFFSESDPLGVIGSFLLDKFDNYPEYFSFKHHYLLHAIDSEILYELLTAIREHRRVEITSYAVRRDELREHTVLPVKIYVGTQSGRQYLLCYHYRNRRPMFFRIDTIRKVKLCSVEANISQYTAFYEKFAENLWGVSTGGGHSLDHIEMTIHIGKNERFFIDKLERERRCGRVEMIDDCTIKFVADVYDASEMLPWLRTFIGRIEKLECSNSYVTRRFSEDLETMRALYGGEENAVQ